MNICIKHVGSIVYNVCETKIMVYYDGFLYKIKMNIYIISLHITKCHIQLQKTQLYIAKYPQFLH